MLNIPEHSEAVMAFAAAIQSVHALALSAARAAVAAIAIT
jgi:hypothetical protein